MKHKIEKQTRSRVGHEGNRKFDSLVKNDAIKDEKPRTIYTEQFTSDNPKVYPDKLSQLRQQIKLQGGKNY